MLKIKQNISNKNSEKSRAYSFRKSAAFFLIITVFASVLSAGCLEKESPRQIFHKNLYVPCMGCFQISSSLEVFRDTGRDRPATHNCYIGFDPATQSFAVTASVIDLSELNISIVLPNGEVAYARNLSAGKCGGFFDWCGELCLEGDHRGFYGVSVNYPGKKLMFHNGSDWDEESYTMADYQLSGGETEIIIVGKMKQIENKMNNSA